MKYNRFYSNVSASYFNPTHHPMYLRSPLTGSGDLTWRQQYNGNWDTEKTILDSNNYKAYIPWIIDTMYSGAQYSVTSKDLGNVISSPKYQTTFSWSGNYMRLRGSNGNMILIQWGWGSTSWSELEVKLVFPTAFYVLPYVFVQSMASDIFGYANPTGSVLGSYAPARVKAVTQTNAIVTLGEKFGVGERSSAFFWFAIG